MTKSSLTLAGLFLAAASQATLFSTTYFEGFAEDNAGGNGGIQTLNPVYTTSGDTYTANVSGATVTADRYLDITWWHTFDTTQATAGSPATAPYIQVTQTMSGLVRQVSGTGVADFTAILTETVKDSTGAVQGSNNPTFNFSQAVGTQWVPFSFSATTIFSAPLASGTSFKDNVIVNTTPGVEVQITSITQNYTPVPEPASMAVLGLGAAALIRRRRK